MLLTRIVRISPLRHRARVALIGTSLAIAAHACGGGTAEPTVNSLEGYVRDAVSKAPLGNALISTDPASQQVFTDAAGSFRIAGPTLRGSVRVLASLSGYENAASIITMRNGANTLSDIMMVRLPTPARIWSVSLSPQRADLVIGAQLTMAYVARDSAGNALSGRGATYQSSNGNVARVNGEGVVTGVATGIANITVTVEGLASDPAVVNVIAPSEVRRVVVRTDRDTLAQGDSTNIAVTIYNQSGVEMSAPFTLASSNPGIGQLQQLTGASRFIALQPGATVITATAGNVTGERALVVVPRRTVASVRLIPDSGRLVVGDSVRFVATALDGSGQAIPGRAARFRSLSPLVATVDSVTGWAVARTVGTARIEASVDQALGASRLTVVPRGSDVASTAIAQQPTDGVAGEALRPVTIELRDAAGQLAVTATDSVIASLSVGSYQGVLDGTLIARSEGGRVRFDNLRVTTPGAFRLELRVKDKPGVAPMLSAPFVVDPAGVLHFASIAAGGEMWFGVLPNGDVYAVGSGSTGRLGIGSSPNFTGIPLQVRTPAPAKQVVAGADHGIIVYPNNTAACWGVNSNAQCSGRVTNNGILSPSVVPGVAATAAFSGPVALHTCYLLTSGDTQCAGDNQYGQLGVGRTSSWNGFASISGGLRFIALAAGAGHTCGIVETRDMYCWGSNAYGQVGYGGTNPNNAPVLVPQPVSGGRKWDAVAVGNQVSCGLEQGTGDAYCWGINASGQVGDGSTGPRYRPEQRVAVPRGVRLIQITAGREHACALSDGGEVYCWGAGGSGRLGYGDDANKPTPVVIPMFRFRYVAAGDSFTCGIVTSGAAWCWGLNRSAQLGGGTNRPGLSTIPSPVSRP